MHYCRQFVHRSRARLYCTEPSKTLYPKGICNYDRTLWRWQCSTTMTHFLWAWQTLSPLSGVQEKGRTEVKPNPIKCLFKYNDRLTRKVESALDSQVPMYTIVVMKSSLTHRTSGWPESHSSMCTESILQPPPIQMPPHSRQSHIFKRAFAHLMMHDSFSLLFMPNDSVWVAVKAGWSCACVAERRWSRIRGQGRVTVWNCYWQANGDGWGWGVEGARDWD